MMYSPLKKFTTVCLLLLGFLSLVSVRSPFPVEAQTTNTIQYIREGQIFVRSNGSSSFTVKDGNAAGEWSSRYILLRPNGSTQDQITKHSSQGGTTQTYTLNENGDYQLILALPFRNWRFDANAPMVLRTNQRKKTFRDIDRDHSVTRLYFNVPQGTSSFSFYAMATRGTDGANNQAKLYRPDGSVHTILDLTIDRNGKTWQKVTVTNPPAGKWSASLRVSGGGNSEGTYWVEGVPNYFSPSADSWFEPQFAKGTVNVAIDLSQTLGKRGLVGAGRVFEPGAPPDAVRNAFLDIGLEGNEVPYNHRFRESRNGVSQNDNDNPNSTDLSGYNFTSFKGVTYSIDTLKAEPVILLSGAADWLVGQIDGTGCPTDHYDKDCRLRDVSTHAEWAELAYATARYHNVVNKHNIKYLRLVDEPNIDKLTASEYARLFNAVGARLASASEPEVQSVRIYSGGVSELKDPIVDYIHTLIREINPQYHQYLGIHPWMMGYGGFGNNYTTPYLKEKFKEFTDALAARGGPGPKKVIVTEVNAKYGDHTNQDEIYYGTFDHSIWWWSMMVNAFVHANTEVFLYYPFEDTGSVHDIRGMVYSDGRYKHVAYATKYFLKHVQPNVIKTEVLNQNAEVEALTTISDDRKKINIALVNKSDRGQSVNLQMNFPNSQQVQWTITKMNSAQDQVEKVVSSNQATVQGNWTLPLDSMDKQSLYSIDMLLAEATEPVSTPTPVPSSTPIPDENPACSADINEDGQIDLADYTIMVSDFFVEPPTHSRTDITKDGIVDLADYTILVNYFFQTCN